MKQFREYMLLPNAVLALAVYAGTPAPAIATVGLANPAAEYCIAEGGLYGVQNEADGQRGVCVLPGADAIDAWAFFRENLTGTTETNAPQIANPAASYCVSVGGLYDLDVSTCTLADGSVVDAWALLREAHASRASLANPAAKHCIDVGGGYSIRSVTSGQTGVCTLPDGTERDAWALFREND